MVGARLEGPRDGCRGQAPAEDEERRLALSLPSAQRQSKDGCPHAEDCNGERRHGRQPRHCTAMV